MPAPDRGPEYCILEVCIRGADEGLISNGDTQAGCAAVHGDLATEQFEGSQLHGCVEVAVMTQQQRRCSSQQP